jgi:hypothetical protein
MNITEKQKIEIEYWMNSEHESPESEKYTFCGFGFLFRRSASFCSA